MTGSRLSHALSSGDAVLPDGPVVVFRPSSDADLSAIERERVTIVQGFRPDFDAWCARGYTCLADQSALDSKPTSAVVFVPRARDHAHGLVAAALAATNGGPVIVDGQKTDGIESLIKAARKAGVEVSAVLSMRHGKLATLTGQAPQDWRSKSRNISGGWLTAPGVFSADAIDPASALLADALNGKLSGTVADLGAGWGYLSARALTANTDITEIHLVEAEHDALDMARINVTDPRARFHWADATNWGDKGSFDHVVMNPPFHTRRRAEPGLGLAFFSAAQRLLKPKGSLWLVANRHLPYEDALNARFGAVTELAGSAGFKLLRADRPSKRIG